MTNCGPNVFCGVVVAVPAAAFGGAVTNGDHASFGRAVMAAIGGVVTGPFTGPVMGAVMGARGAGGRGETSSLSDELLRSMWVQSGRVEEEWQQSWPTSKPSEVPPVGTIVLSR